MMTDIFLARHQSTTCLTRAMKAGSIAYVRAAAWLFHAHGMRTVLNPCAAIWLIKACVAAGPQQPSPHGGSSVLPRFHPWLGEGSCANTATGSTSRHAIAINRTFNF